ncbi:MAG: hypothetical protein JRI59_08130 [Deltaproteobacteria bacterium]|nr:hypothetical protein [Deltaproteobacteria bacterium]
MRKTTQLVLWLLLGVGLVAPGPAHPKNAVVTIQSKHGYGRTLPMRSKTVAYLRKLGPVAVADDPDNRQVPAVLQGLADGDLLILNLHSNSRVFGYGGSGPTGVKKTEEWGNFYRTFGLNKPPRLALVMIHGCIFDMVGDKVVAASDAQIEAIRKSLNAVAILSFNCQINPISGSWSFQGLAKGLAEGRRIASLIKTKSLRFLVAPGIDRNQATLDSLRGAVLGFKLEKREVFGSGPFSSVHLKVPHVVSPGKTYRLRGSFTHPCYPRGNYHLRIGFCDDKDFSRPGVFSSLVVPHRYGFKTTFEEKFTVPAGRAGFLKIQISLRSFSRNTGGYYGEQYIYRVPILKSGP